MQETLPPTNPIPPPSFPDRATKWIGSVQSLIVHTIIFIASFLSILFGAQAERVLLILTTIVSLEAIYLAIFIQISVNRNTADIAYIQEDLEDIAEDVDEIADDVDKIEHDIDEIQADVEGIERDIDDIAEDVEDIAEDVEGIEKDIDDIAEDVEDLAEEFEGDSQDLNRDPIKRVTGLPELEPTLRQILTELQELREEVRKK